MEALLVLIRKPSQEAWGTDLWEDIQAIYEKAYGILKMGFGTYMRRPPKPFDFSFKNTLWTSIRFLMSSFLVFCEETYLGFLWENLPVFCEKCLISTTLRWHCSLLLEVFLVFYIKNLFSSIRHTDLLWEELRADLMSPDVRLHDSLVSMRRPLGILRYYFQAFC